MKTKKLCAYTTILMLILFCLPANAQKITDITYRELPSKSQSFIKKYFPRQIVENAFISRVTVYPTYNVVMRNRTEIIFDNKGEWKEIDGHGNGVPTNMLPKESRKTIKKRYKNIGTLRIYREAGDYNVTLTNNTELRFDRKGKLINIHIMNNNNLER